MYTFFGTLCIYTYICTEGAKKMYTHQRVPKKCIHVLRNVIYVKCVYIFVASSVCVCVYVYVYIYIYIYICINSYQCVFVKIFKMLDVLSKEDAVGREVGRNASWAVYSGWKVRSFMLYRWYCQLSRLATFLRQRLKQVA